MTLLVFSSVYTHVCADRESHNMVTKTFFFQTDNVLQVARRELPDSCTFVLRDKFLITASVHPAGSTGIQDSIQ